MPSHSPLEPSIDGLKSAAGLKVEVRLFAAAAALTGTRLVILHVAPGSSLIEVSRRLTELYPALQMLVGVSRWAVDELFVGQEFILHSDATIAMIPPVSGG